ncbi:MAG: creatininase family protein [Rhodopirellula sp.]|nr:creatininase family protein [Rhodopirellula sp.]
MKMPELRVAYVLWFAFMGAAGADEVQPPTSGRMEVMTPDELEAVVAKTPVAFLPLGTFEHHGWHLPVCCDGINAHVLCERTAAKTGGVELPTFFYGTDNRHETIRLVEKAGYPAFRSRSL